jgi:acetyl esterase/lipase
MNLAQHIFARGLVMAVVLGGTCGEAVAQADLNVERLKQLLKRFPEADTDKDGKLTAEEARSYLRKMRSAKAADTKPTPPAAAKSPTGDAPSADAAAKSEQSRAKAAKEKTYDKDAGPRPDLEDVAYGSPERLTLDLWKAKSDQPTPILVFFHGGGGDKLMYRGNRLLAFCLKNGVSAAAVNYRPNNQFPFPVPMQDAGRAIQFLRQQATEFNLDPQRIAATGTSLGANVSTWLAYHDDIADPNSDDPVLRQSSRLRFVIAGAGQTFNDMELFRERVYPYPVPGAETERSRDKAREISAIYHVTKGDPPIFMHYGTALQPLPLAKDTPRGELIHNPAFGLLLKEKLDELGIENHFYHGGNKPPPEAQEKFIMKHFFGQAE